MLARVLCLLLAPVVVSLSAEAGEMAKEGTDNYTTTYIVTSSSTMKLGERTFTSLEFRGISRNDKGADMFNNMSAHCIGSRDADGRETVSRGACTDMDKDGDLVFTTYESKAPQGTGAPLTGTHIFVGGTGKYTGITGKADYTVQPVKAADNVIMFIVPHKATWKLQ